jgi:hypothetical protein
MPGTGGIYAARSDLGVADHPLQQAWFSVTMQREVILIFSSKKVICLPEITKRHIFRMVIPRYPMFNVFSTVADKTTALGPISVATCISKLPGWDVEVIDENNFRFPGPLDRCGLPDHAALQELRPADAVGFYGGLSCTIPRLQAVAGYYQQAGIFTIGGGQHLDALPDEALHNGMSVVVHGEGEETACEVLAAWEHAASFAAIPGISHLRDGAIASTPPRAPIQNYSRLPLPDFGLLRFARLDIYPINRTRGCGMNCEFCTVKGRARSASPERLLAQISYLAEAFQARSFFVVDDQFAQDRQETIRFCEMLADYAARMELRLRVAARSRISYRQGLHGITITSVRLDPVGHILDHGQRDWSALVVLLRCALARPFHKQVVQTRVQL